MRHRLYDDGRLGLPRQRRQVLLVEMVRELQLRALRRRGRRRRVRRIGLFVIGCSSLPSVRVVLFLSRNKSAVILKRHFELKNCSVSIARLTFALFDLMKQALKNNHIQPPPKKVLTFLPPPHPVVHRDFLAKYSKVAQVGKTWHRQ